MKRIITLLIIMSVFFSFNYSVFAQEDQNETKLQNQVIKAELANMKSEFINNKNIIENYKKEISEKSLEMKTKIATLKESEQQFSKNEMEEIKRNLEILKSDKMKLREINKNQLPSLIEKYKTAMKSCDFNAAKTYLQQVLEIQELKIQILGQISSDLNNILATTN